MTDSLLVASASLGWLLLMFVPLERFFSAQPDQKIIRRYFGTDLLFFFGQYLIFSTVSLVIITTVFGWFNQFEFSLWTQLQSAFTNQHIAIQIVIAVMAGDFFAYWGHRAQHKFDILWRFHSIHHTTEELDFLAAHREHPLDGVYTQALINVPAFILGLNLNALMGLIAFRGVWAIFIHSNVKIPLGPLRYLFGSPALHHWHHDRDRDVGNYANLGPWLDVLFGTYYLEDSEPESLGIDEPHETSYWGLLLHPFRSRKDVE